MVKLSEVQKFAEEFLHCLDFSNMSCFVTLVRNVFLELQDFKVPLEVNITCDFN